LSGYGLAAIAASEAKLLASNAAFSYLSELDASVCRSLSAPMAQRIGDREGPIPATHLDLGMCMKTAAMEATMFTAWIYDHLRPQAAAVKVAHPLFLFDD
jgi:transposase